MPPIRALFAALALGLAAFSAAPAEAQSADPKFQIVKATEDRVWRLDTQTGEIAVCTLSGENLVCTTTSEAAAVPEKSYAEIDAERRAAAEQAAAAKEAERQQELQLIDRVLAFLRELIATAMGESGAN